MQELTPVGFIARIRPGETGRIDPWSAIEGIYFEPGIICQGNLLCKGGDDPGFYQRIFLKGVPGLIGADGFHPTVTGYRRMADIFFAEIVSRYAIPARAPSLTGP